MIKTQVIGHLGNDAQVNDVNGKTVINFSVAHTSKYKDANGTEITSTIWANCSWWINRANIIPYLKKGTLVYVEGTPSLDTYKNGQGVIMPQLRLRVESLNLLSSTNRQENTQVNSESVDDLPF